MESVKLEYLASYSPFGLEIKATVNENLVFNTTDWGIRTYSDYPIFCRNQSNERYALMLSQVKPILRPLSDLTKEIEHNGRKLIFSNFYMSKHNVDTVYKCLNNNLDLSVHLYASVVFRMIEFHFDVFGLIEKGLAISYEEANLKTSVQQ